MRGGRAWMVSTTDYSECWVLDGWSWRLWRLEVGMKMKK